MVEATQLIEQEITDVDIWECEGELHYHAVDRREVTKIEKFTLPGMHCDIPYIRVWQGDQCLAEYCQHNIIGITYKVKEKSDE